MPMHYSGKVEFAEARKIRTWNKPHYRLAHWPLWIWVFFLAPGPLTFSLFARGFGWGNLAWLAVVLIGTGIAGWSGQLPRQSGIGSPLICGGIPCMFLRLL